MFFFSWDFGGEGGGLPLLVACSGRGDAVHLSVTQSFLFKCVLYENEVDMTSQRFAEELRPSFGLRGVPLNDGLRDLHHGHRRGRYWQQRECFRGRHHA